MRPLPCSQRQAKRHRRGKRRTWSGWRKWGEAEGRGEREARRQAPRPAHQPPRAERPPLPAEGSGAVLKATQTYERLTEPAAAPSTGRSLLPQHLNPGTRTDFLLGSPRPVTGRPDAARAGGRVGVASAGAAGRRDRAGQRRAGCPGTAPWPPPLAFEASWSWPLRRRAELSVFGLCCVCLAVPFQAPVSSKGYVVLTATRPFLFQSFHDSASAVNSST